ncbi:hypothetical protein ABG067_000090 [Albugo candida]
MMSNYRVQMTDDSTMSDFNVVFHGPKETPYEGGIWNIHVSLPNEYPFKSPSIGFVNRIYHPNVDDMSGSVCLDVINQTWSPMFDLVNVFDVFIPQLLRYPNPTDPLNGEAASLMLKDIASYNSKVKGDESNVRTGSFKITWFAHLEHVSKYATESVDLGNQEEDSEVSDMSEVEC